jgi:4,5:9,10-diseco-3-hydroxy-5,9,17-trioxoandrosta-1(10),2-diene-4-oate hydrolase
MSAPEDRFVLIDSVRTRYWSGGRSGSPVLLLHGIGAFSETWLMNFDALSRTHRVFALDLPGHGLSDRPPHPYTIEYFTQFIDAFVTSCRLDRVHLVGNSFGGGIALRYASVFPQKTNKLVLVANPGFSRELSLPLRLVGIPIIGKILLRSRRNEESRRNRSMAILKGMLHDTDSVDLILKEILIDMYSRMGAIPHGGWAVHDILRRYTNLSGIKPRFMDEFRRVVQDVQAETLIVWGKNDRVIPSEHAVLGKKNMLHAELHTIGKCGHMPQVEHPDEFNRVVLEFLER